MPKFYGEIGYATLTETSPGVWDDVIVKKNYYVEILRNTKRDRSSEKVNDDLVVNNLFSIIADPYASENFFKMRYITWMGVRWKIDSVDVQQPRLVLTIGERYNGN